LWVEHALHLARSDYDRLGHSTCRNGGTPVRIHCLVQLFVALSGE
jgi:hypothetical protein